MIEMVGNFGTSLVNTCVYTIMLKQI